MAKIVLFIKEKEAHCDKNSTRVGKKEEKDSYVIQIEL